MREETLSSMHDARDAEDRRLLEAGDHKGLLAGYWNQVYERCYIRLRDRDHAEEARQVVMERLWRELRGGKTYRVPYRVVVWQVTRWTLDGFYPPAKHDGELPEQLEGEPGDNPYTEWESKQLLEQLFAELPEGQRVVCELRYLEGLEQADIAARLGIKPNAVYQRLFNAHEKLRELLDA